MNKLKGIILAGVLALSLGPRPAFAASWKDVIYNAEGDIVKFTALNSISPSYFYNAFAGRSEIGATTQVFWVGSYVSADVGYSVPNAEDGNTGTLILGGNLHVDRLIASAFPNKVEFIRDLLPSSIDKFWDAINVGVYVGHDTTNRELAGGIYSSLELKF